MSLVLVVGRCRPQRIELGSVPSFQFSRRSGWNRQPFFLQHLVELLSEVTIPAVGTILWPVNTGTNSLLILWTPSLPGLGLLPVDLFLAGSLPGSQGEVADSSSLCPSSPALTCERLCLFEPSSPIPSAQTACLALPGFPCAKAWNRSGQWAEATVVLILFSPVS